MYASMAGTGCFSLWNSQGICMDMHYHAIINSFSGALSENGDCQISMQNWVWANVAHTGNFASIFDTMHGRLEIKMKT